MCLKDKNNFLQLTDSVSNFKVQSHVLSQSSLSILTNINGPVKQTIFFKSLFCLLQIKKFDPLDKHIFLTGQLSHK